MIVSSTQGQNGHPTVTWSQVDTMLCLNTLIAAADKNTKLTIPRTLRKVNKKY